MRVRLADAELTAPIPTPRRNIICVGRNYAEHAAEFGKSGYGRVSQPGGRRGSRARVGLCEHPEVECGARVRGVLLVDEIVGQSERWTAATRHRFLDLVRDGAIDLAAFDRWLVQDALFVSDLLWFQGAPAGPRSACSAADVGRWRRRSRR